jgi:ornithine cyclodeaminase
MVTILNEDQLRQRVTVSHEALDAVADGFNRLAAGQATMPPILRLDIPEHNGEVDVKTAYLQGLDGFAIKISSGFFDNQKIGLPSLSGMMILLSSRTGFPVALLLDNGYLTDVRTGMAGALAARHLAPQKVNTAGVIGAGAQARYQIRSLKLVRDFERVLVYARNPQQARQYVQEMEAELDLPVTVAESVETVVRQSQVVVTTTPAKEAYLRAEWLHPGLHITAMGSDAEDKQELEAAVFSRADLAVCDRKSQAFRLGELHHARDAGLISEEDVVELGDLTSGAHPGRRDEQHITVCDLTGTGVQDTAIALLAYKKSQS